MIWSPDTVRLTGASGLFAGPPSTEPSAAEKTLPWQAQLIFPSATEATTQPWWVHTALNALNAPAVGWVTTILRSVRMTPPPTGTLPALIGADLLQGTARTKLL